MLLPVAARCFGAAAPHRQPDRGAGGAARGKVRAGLPGGQSHGQRGAALQKGDWMGLGCAAGVVSLLCCHNSHQLVILSGPPRLPSSWPARIHGLDWFAPSLLILQVAQLSAHLPACPPARPTPWLPDCRSCLSWLRERFDAILPPHSHHASKLPPLYLPAAFRPGRDPLQPRIVQQPPLPGHQHPQPFPGRGLGQGRRPRCQRPVPGGHAGGCRLVIVLWGRVQLQAADNCWVHWSCVNVSGT